MGHRLSGDRHCIEAIEVLPEHIRTFRTFSLFVSRIHINDLKIANLDPET